MKASDHQARVRQAMEGNIAAYFHPFEEQVAFLYPNGTINIYDSRNWQNIGTKNVSTVWQDGEEKSTKEIIGSADMSMAQDGFDRAGRDEEANVTVM